MAKTVLDERWLDILLESGYRVTAPRRLIVEIMASSPRALNPLEVYAIGRKEYPGLGLVTVYRTLEKLEELKLLQRVHHPDGCNMYLRAAQGHETDLPGTPPLRRERDREDRSPRPELLLDRRSQPGMVW